MSNFICSKCGQSIMDSPYGYITGCEHYPLKGGVRSEGETKLINEGWELDLFSTFLSRKHSYHKLVGKKHYVKLRKEKKQCLNSLMNSNSM